MISNNSEPLIVIPDHVSDNKSLIYSKNRKIYDLIRLQIKGIKYYYQTLELIIKIMRLSITNILPHIILSIVL